MNYINGISEKDHQINLEIIKQLRLMDDDFMSMAFDGEKEATELLLHIVLQRSDIKVEEVSVQKEYRSITERTIKLDIYAKDINGKTYDIEIQRADRGAIPQRARFHSSMIDSQLLGSGEPFSKLSESYVIFITENDVLGLGCPLYHIERRIEEAKFANFNDGSHILYVNGSYHNNDDPIGRLMHDFRCVNAADMYEPLAKRMQYLKEEEGGQGNMCKLIEDRVNQVAAEVAAESEAKTKIEMMRTLINESGFSIEQALAVAKIPASEQDTYRKLLTEE
jgi:hypothetical protein